MTIGRIPLGAFAPAAVLALMIASAAAAATVTFDNECGAKNWFQTCLKDGQPHTNWDNDAFPAPGDDVTIGGDLGPAAAGAQPDIDINSLTAPGGLRLGDGTDLILRAVSAVNDLTWFRTTVTTTVAGGTAGLVLGGNSEWGPSAGALGPIGQMGRIRNVGSLTVTASGNQLHRLELVNEGTVAQRGSLQLDSDSRITNDSEWTLNQNNSGVGKIQSTDPDTAVFLNGATLRNTDGKSTIEVVFESDDPAVIDVQKGELDITNEAFFGGPISVGAGAYLVALAPLDRMQTFRGTVQVSGEGEMRVIGGERRRHQVDGAGMLVNLLNGSGDPLPSLLLTNVNLEIAMGGTLLNRGRVRWGAASLSAGTVSGAGILKNAQGARLQIEASDARLATALQNEGDVIQTANLTVADGSIDNAHGAQWTLGPKIDLFDGGTGASQIKNHGTFSTAESPTGPSRSNIHVRLDMDGDGKLEVAGGTTLGLTGGGVWSSPTPVVVAGSLVLGEGSLPSVKRFVIARSASFAPADTGARQVVVFEKAQVAIGDPLDPQPNVTLTNEAGVDLNLSGGSIVGLGALVNRGTLSAYAGRLGDPLLRLTIDNVSNVHLLGAVELNGILGNEHSLVAFDNSHLTLMSGEEQTAIVNTGGFALGDLATIDGTGVLVNRDEGTVYFGVPDGLARIDVTVDNNGLVRVPSGTLRLGGPVVQISNGTLTGGRWQVEESGRLLIVGTAVTTIGSGAQVSLVGPDPGPTFAMLRRVEGTLDLTDDFHAADDIEVLGAGRLRVLDSKTLKVTSLRTGPDRSVIETVEEQVAPGLTWSAPDRQRQRAARLGASASPSPVEPLINFDLAGGLFLNEGTAIPGALGAVGSFGIDGDYTQTATGTLQLDLGPEKHDQLHVTGTASLDGALIVDLLDGYVPQPADVIVAVSAGAVSGRFANAGERVFTSAGAFNVTYTASEVVLSGFDPNAVPPTPSPTLPTGGTPGATATPTADTTPSETPPTAPMTQSPTPTSTPITGGCPGDCDDDGRVVVNELVRGVNIALGTAPIASCPAFDVTPDGAVSVAELIAAVNAALNGCTT